MSCFTITMSPEEKNIFFNSRSEGLLLYGCSFPYHIKLVCKGSPGRRGLWMNRIFYLCNVYILHAARRR
jgi:hypothetical protein